VPEISGLINDAASPALREASLNLVLHERIVLVVSAKNGLIAGVNDRMLETTDRALPDILGQRLEEVWRLSSQTVDNLLDKGRAGSSSSRSTRSSTAAGGSAGCASTALRCRARARNPSRS
jgi:hypothetical protein